jgi:hypothetical protein
VTAVAAEHPAAGIRASLTARFWIVGWWAVGRSVVLATAAILDAFGPRGLIGNDERTHVLGALGAWDGRWYRTVAENGYLLEPGRQSDPAFFPLYPILLRGLHAIGVDDVAAGIILSNIAFLAALVLVEQLTRELLGAAIARRTTIYLALFPLGYVFSMEYPESIVLCVIALAALAARRRRWIAVAALTAVGTLARPEMLFLSLALLPLARRETSASKRGLAIGAILAPLAALGSFALYLQLHLGDPLAWTHAERAWGRRFTPLGIVRAIQDVPTSFAGNAWIVRDIAFFVLYLALLWVALRRGVPKAWVASAALVVVLPTFSGSFHSDARFGLLAPAVFWGLAAAGERRGLDAVIRWTSALLLAGGTVSLAYVFP